MADGSEVDAPLDRDDTLGRDVQSARDMRRLINSQPVPKVFRGRRDERSLSTDRLNIGTDAEMAELGEHRARANGNKSFYGWSTVTVEQASGDGRSVCLAPIAGNPYHAEIELNIDGRFDHWDKQKEHSAILAAYAVWRPKPD